MCDGKDFWLLLLLLLLLFLLLAPTKWKSYCVRPISRLRRRRATYSTTIFSATNEDILTKLCRNMYGVKTQCYYYTRLWLVENLKNGGWFKFPNTVKSPISLKIWVKNTQLLLGTYSKSFMAFPLVTLKMTFDLFFKVTCQKSCFGV
jgi:hypothetical protein